MATQIVGTSIFDFFKAKLPLNLKEGQRVRVVINGETVVEWEVPINRALTGRLLVEGTVEKKVEGYP